MTTSVEDTLHELHQAAFGKMPPRNETHRKHTGNTNTAEEAEIPIQPHELRRATKKTATDTATGPDGINYTLTMCLVTNHEPFILTLKDACLIQGKYPREWKQGKIRWLAKNGKDPQEPASYRPITVLPILARSFERIPHDRLYFYTQQYAPLHPRQYGFVGGKPTTMMLHDLSGDIQEAKKGKPTPP